MAQKKRLPRRPAKADPPAARPDQTLAVERVQIGARMEKRLVKVLKGLAEVGDMSLGQLLEDIVLHAFEGESTFGPRSQEKIKLLKKTYELNYDTHASYRFAEE